MPNAIGYGHFGVRHWNRHSVRALGGTSRIWNGQCITLMERDFDNPVSGVSWPISRTELVPYYRRAVDILDVDPSIVDAEWPWCPGFVRRPIARNKPIRFGLKYVDLLEESQTIHVALASSVVGFDANASRTVVEALKFFHHPSGSRHQLPVGSRGRIVLAGGGISNAQLLLQPRSGGGVPVGNESGHAGKFLMEHPHFGNVAEVVIDEAHDSNLTLVPDDDYARRHALLGSALDCQIETTDHPMVEYLAGEYGKPFHYYTSGARSEMMPVAGNEVFLTGDRDAAGCYRPGVRCVLGARDLINVENTLRLLGEALIASRKGRVRIMNDNLYRRQSGGGHIMGTTRMGVSRSTSVVR